MNDREKPLPVAETRQPDIAPPTPPSGVRTRSVTQEFRIVAKSTKIWVTVVTFAGALTVVGVLIGGYEVFITKAEAAGQKAAKEVLDEALPPIRSDVRIVSERHEDLHSDFKEHVVDEKETHRRQERKLDAMLRHEGIRNPAPTPREEP